MEIKTKRYRFIILVIIIWAFISSFTRLGYSPIYIENEAREGIYVRAMLATGNYILPSVPDHVECGETIPDKPPLFHWLGTSATSIRSFIRHGKTRSGIQRSKEVNEWIIRFPSAVAGILTIIAILFLARDIIGIRASLLAAGCLLTSWQFFHQSRYGRVDMIATAGITWTMLLLGRALLTTNKTPFRIAAITAALSVLSKGPIGIILPVFAGGIWGIIKSIQTKSIKWLGGKPWLSSVAIFILIAAPWYLASAHINWHAFYHSQILEENLEQFSGINGRMRLFYYIKPFLTDAFPWSIIALLGIITTLKNRNNGALFCVVWWFSFLLFFTMAAYKRKAYILPVLPATTLLAGYWLDKKLPAIENNLKLFYSWILSHIKILSISGLIAVILGSTLFNTSYIKNCLGVNISAYNGVITIMGGIVFILTTLSIIHFIRIKNWWFVIFLSWIGLSAIFLGPIATGEAIAGMRKSPKPLVNKIIRSLPSNENITVIGVGDDPSMLLLLYFPNWQRINIVPQNTPLPQTLQPGYYLFKDSTWQTLNINVKKKIIWHDNLKERSKLIPIVMVKIL